MATEMIERVAKAVAEVFDSHDGEGWECFQTQFRMAARAAVEAMREPIPAMTDNAFVNGPLPLGGMDGSVQARGEHEHVREIYRAMIDAALHP